MTDPLEGKCVCGRCLLPTDIDELLLLNRACQVAEKRDWETGEVLERGYLIHPATPLQWVAEEKGA